nr:DUF3397 domain-containing protein [Aquibacillus halophilus]
MIGLVITVPILLTMITYIIARNLYKNKWKAIHISVNYTTMFYIFSVATLIHVIFNINFIGLILIVLITSLAISVVIQWKVKEEIVFRYAWRGFWRFSFLLFGCSYIGLILIGITMKILNL